MNPGRGDPESLAENLRICATRRHDSCYACGDTPNEKPMQILFAHQNFPAQFGDFGTYLARTGWDVAFVTAAEGAKPPPGCRMVKMTPHRDPTQGVHRFAYNLEKAMINAQAFANAAIRARGEGLNPDVVVAHSGWGSGTFAKAVWPHTKFVAYVEWFYRYPPVDAVQAPAPQTEEDGRAQALARNTPTLLDLAEADLVFCPSRFQASQFPRKLSRDMVIMHDGVDTDFHAPSDNPVLPEAVKSLPADAEIVTYATRGMELHRGFPEFMRALARLQAERPKLHAIIVGQDRIAYGPSREDGRGWKEAMREELDLDESRIHWTGLLPRKQYLGVLQAADVHVYLSVPFVLSWSMIEAMSIGCPLVASDTPPVREAATDGEDALLVDHSDTEALARSVARLLDDRSLADRLGRTARRTAIRNYSASWIWPWRDRVLGELVRAG